MRKKKSREAMNKHGDRRANIEQQRRNIEGGGDEEEEEEGHLGCGKEG